MGRAILPLLWFLCILYKSHAQYIPPDIYSEKYMPSIGFWKNHGQVIGTDGSLTPDVKYYTQGSVPLSYMRTKSRVSFTLPVVDTLISTVDTVYHIEMVPYGTGAAQVDPVGTVLNESHLNYHLPHCGTTGITNVEGYSRVLYENIFPYVDLHFYSGGFGQKMALVCRPGSSLSQVKLRFNGQDSLNTDLWGSLKLFSDGKFFILPQAVAYQVNSDNSLVPVPWGATYTADEDAGLIGFFNGEYDTSKPLVLLIGPPPAMGGQNNTPGVCWSSYLGGDGRDEVEDSDVDVEGSYYVVGRTESQNIYFPIQTGVVYYNASPMAFVSKFTEQYEILWSTYYGGSSGYQSARCVKARPGIEPNILVGGVTNANDLWTVNPNDGSYFDQSSSSGGFLAELNPAGEAIWATYIGDGANWSVLDVDLHPNGKFAVVGHAGFFLPEEQELPDPESDHWNYAGSIDQNTPGDGFIVLFNTDRRTIWSTYISGNYGESVETVKFGDYKIVITGKTNSTDLPLKDGGMVALDEGYHGSSDVFIMEFDLLGDLQWSTYFGGSLGESIGDQGLAIQPGNGDGKEDVFIVGMSSSDDLPLVDGPNWHDNTFKPGLQGYILRIDGEDRSIEWLTHAKGLGSVQKSTHLNAVLVDQLRRVFVGGLSWDPSFVLQNGTGVYSATGMYGVGDAVVMCFSDEQELHWSTYFGGQESGIDGDDIRTLAIAGTERLYAAGTTYAAYSPVSFFPFTDPIGDDDWFDSAFYPQTDGFTAAFCIEGLPTRIVELAEIRYPLRVQRLSTSSYRISGLNGQGIAELCDARGRVLESKRLRMAEDGWQLDLSGYCSGMYLVSSPGVGAVRILHEP